MKRTTTALVISAGVLLYGCSASPARQSPASTPPPTTAPPATWPAPNIAGNWQFTATSNNPGAHPFLISGGINQADSTLSGALHIDNPDCFDPLISRSLAGTISSGTSPGTSSLTVTGSDGQVVTLSGNFTYLTYFNGEVYSFAGTYKVDGGCAAGDLGTVGGKYIYSIAPSDGVTWGGTFTNSSAQQIFHGSGSITQSGSADAAGSFAIGGDAKFDIACLSTGTIKAGTYPSGSFILGTSVALEFATNSGVLTFLGTFDQDSSVNNGNYTISGNYIVSGSSCNQSGTAVLNVPINADIWGY